MRSAAISFVLALMGAVAPASGQSPESPRSDSPFSATAHLDDPDFVAAAQPFLDAVWALAIARLGSPRRAAPDEMTVHVYASREEFEEVAKALGGPDPRIFPGFADYETGTAHVLVGPGVRTTNGRLSPVAVGGMVHEAMHLAVGAVRGRSMAFYPRWFVEGLAMWAETQVTLGDATAGEAQTGLRDVYSASRARTLLQDGRIEPVSELMLDRYGDLGQVDEYPINRVLFQLLMDDHGEAMARVLPAALDLEVSPAVPLQLRDLVRREMGESAWERLDDRLHERIRALAVDLPEPEFDPPPDARGVPGDPDFHPGSPDIRWAGETEANRLRVTATVTVRDAGQKQCDFVFGRHRSSWLRVCIVPEAGVLVLAREQDGDGPGGWEVLARSRRTPTLRLGEPARLEIAASSGSVRVSIDGKHAVTARTGKRPFRGRWGIGAPPGCRASWRDVRVQ